MTDYQSYGDSVEQRTSEPRKASSYQPRLKFDEEAFKRSMREVRIASDMIRRTEKLSSDTWHHRINI